MPEVYGICVENKCKRIINSVEQWHYTIDDVGQQDYYTHSVFTLEPGVYLVEITALMRIENPALIGLRLTEATLFDNKGYASNMTYQHVTEAITDYPIGKTQVLNLEETATMKLEFRSLGETGLIYNYAKSIVIDVIKLK